MRCCRTFAAWSERSEGRLDRQAGNQACAHLYRSRNVYMS